MRPSSFMGCLSVLHREAVCRTATFQVGSLVIATPVRRQNRLRTQLRKACAFGWLGYVQPMKTFLSAALLIGISLAFLRPGLAQKATPVAPADVGQLRDTIARMDRKLFDAFNAHDAEAVIALFT